MLVVVSAGVPESIWYDALGSRQELGGCLNTLSLVRSLAAYSALGRVQCLDVYIL